MCSLGSMDFLIMRNHDYLFIIANRGLKSIRASKHKKRNRKDSLSAY